MNIFILDEDLETCASYMVDKHVVKMLTEYAQMLSTAQRYYGIDIGYKSTHLNHPCTKWVCESNSNYNYLVNLSKAVHNEYKLRYGQNKIHGAFKMIDEFLSIPPSNMPDIGLTPFPQAMPDIYKSGDAIEAYRNYYRGEKQHISKWKHNNIPYWFKN
jgi:hypothetical protein